jgi:hypothetical protein
MSARSPVEVELFTGDACQIDEMVGGHDDFDSYDGAVMSIFFAGFRTLMAMHQWFAKIIAKGGVVVLVTPFSWLLEFTPRSKWLDSTIPFQRNPSIPGMF